MGLLGKLFGKITGGGGNAAGGGAKGGGRFKELFEMAKPALNLTADQETSIKNIFMEFRQERKELKQGGGDQAEIREARKEAKQKIMALLTPEQLKTLRQKMGEWKEEL